MSIFRYFRQIPAYISIYRTKPSTAPLSIFSDEEYQAVFSLYHDFTKMVPTRVAFKLGLKKDAPEILKPIFTAREATIPNMLEELAYVPKLMQDTELHSAFETIIFALKDNRKSEGRR